MAGPGAAFRRLGALSGAGALGLASYGAHGQGLGWSWAALGARRGVRCGDGVCGDCEGSQPPDRLQSPKPFRAARPGAVGPRTARACFRPAEASWGALPGAHEGRAGNFCLSFPQAPSFRMPTERSSLTRPTNTTSSTAWPC